MTFTVVELVAAFFFVASSGLFFNERFRTNRWLVLFTGLIALVSTYFLTEELIDRAISRRLEATSERPATPPESAAEVDTTTSAQQPSPEMPPLPTSALPEMVRLPGRNFEVGRYEVTFAQWDACVEAGGCNGYRPDDQRWGRGNRPVINVNWNDAQAYVQWLSQRTGLRYRLLTSAEWEFAARAGTTTNFSWGDEDPVCDQGARNGANFRACTDLRTRPVGSFQPNWFGLYDMHGNVLEWVEDCHSRCSERVLRGGAWGNAPDVLRSAVYFGYNLSERYGAIGFRVARTL